MTKESEFDLDRVAAVYNAVMAEAKSRESRARWLELILDEVDPYKTHMLLQDWLRGVINALMAENIGG